MCAKFRIDHLSYFHTGAHQVFTLKSFPGKISLTMKTTTWNIFKHIFWSCQANLSFARAKKVNIWISFGYFTFLILSFCWNEVTKNHQTWVDIPSYIIQFHEIINKSYFIIPWNHQEKKKQDSLCKKGYCKAENITEKIWRSHWKQIRDHIPKISI